MMSMHGYYKVSTKLLVSAEIAVGPGVAGAAPATADTTPASTGPSPFSTLSCSCRETAPAGNPALTQEINRGIREGRSAGPLPASAQRTQPRP